MACCLVKLDEQFFLSAVKIFFRQRWLSPLEKLAQGCSQNFCSEGV